MKFFRRNIRKSGRYSCFVFALFLLAGCAGRSQQAVPVSEEVKDTSDQAEERQRAESYTYEELFGADYVDDELYAEIKDICKSIDWTVSFDPGDVTKYALYKEKFKNFIDGETTVRIKETGEELPIYDLGEFRTDIELEKFDIDSYSYYFFDMNGDEAPELCVTDKARYIYVFQYDEERDQIVLWKEYISGTIFLMGTQKLGFAGGTAGHGLISIDENGDRVFFVRFKEVGGGPYRNDIEDYGYLVSLPEYVELRDDMIEQAIYEDERYYFRVTEEQFKELTKDYNDAVKKAQDALDEVTYTYTELFE